MIGQIVPTLNFSPFRRSLLFRTIAISSLLSQQSSAMSSSASTSTQKGALIFLHGLGDTPLGWSSLEDQLPELQPNLSKLEYVFPASPTIPISINGGMNMPGWFDLYDWPIGVGIKNDDKGLEKAVKCIEDYVDELQKKGIDRSKIVIGGFSQGGAVALRTVYNRSSDGKMPYAGCVNLSGWLTFEDGIENKDVPLFWGHGSFDDKVLFEQQQYGVQKLTEMGVTQIQADSYSMGHSSHPKEMIAFAKFLNDILFKDE